MLATEHMTCPSSILKKKLKMKLFPLDHSLLFNPCFSQSVFRFTNNQGGNQQHIIAHSSSTSRVRPSRAWQQQNPQQTHLPAQNQKRRGGEEDGAHLPEETRTARGDGGVDDGWLGGLLEWMDDGRESRPSPRLMFLLSRMTVTMP